jgi:hypothetical protein
MNDMSQLYMTFTVGFAFISMGLYLAGAWACLVHRRLSPWLIVTSVGFIGDFLAYAIGQLAAYHALKSLDLFYLFSLVANFLGLVSTVIVVLGLTMSLADIRRKLALSMEPKHVRG